MKIFDDIKLLRQKEKHYTDKILEKLMVIENDKLFVEMKFHSLFQYLVKGLGYTDSEASIRLNAVRFMLRDERARTKVLEGKISLSNAADGNRILNQSEKVNQECFSKVLDKAETLSNRSFNNEVKAELKMKRREQLVLSKHMISQFDKLRKIYGDLSTYELIQILLEKELRAPKSVHVDRPQRLQKEGSRHIPIAVKRQVYKKKCGNCETQHSREYDHKLKFSHGGKNIKENIQMLCRSCNGRKEIVIRQTGFFA
jgi:hypothetical protein